MPNHGLHAGESAEIKTSPCHQEPYILEQGLANFFVQGQSVSSLSLVGHIVFVTTTQLCHFSESRPR